MPCSSINCEAHVAVAVLRIASAIRSSSPNSSGVSAPRGLRPRKYSSSAPGFEIGSNVGLGMKRLIFSPTIRRVLPSTSTHCIARLRNFGSMWRVKASSAS